MTKLNKNWLTDGHIDFEYKKYVLLAYLDYVAGEFSRQKLFPGLTDVHDHLTSGLRLQKEKEALQRTFPRKVVRVDPASLHIDYEEVFRETPELSELNGILDYAIPLFSKTLREGEARVEDIQAELLLAPVGIMPLRNEEGYLFIARASSAETVVFQYRVTLYGRHACREIDTTHVGVFRRGISSTVESIKAELIKKYHQLPNPATYIVEAKRNYPLEETLLPLAKQLMVRNLIFT